MCKFAIVTDSCCDLPQELEKAMEVLTTSMKLAALEKTMNH